MPLTLTIRNANALENGSPCFLVLDRKGARIGRAGTADWCLPDPTLHISSQHCEIRFAGGRYELIDYSTNGTFLLGEASRLAGTHTIDEGDVFVIGRFEIEARLDDAAASQAAARSPAPPPVPEWKGWVAAGQGPGASPAAPPPPPGPASSPDWGPPPAWMPERTPDPQGWGGAPAAPAPPSGDGWAPQAAPPPPASPAAAPGWGPPPSGHPGPTSAPPVASVWDRAPAEPATPASPWSSPVDPARPVSANDIWGQFAASNAVDWNRGGFGSPSVPPATIATAHFTPPPTPAPMPTPQDQSAPPPPPPVAASAPLPTADRDALAALAVAAGLDRDKLQLDPAETLGLAGALLRKLAAGLVILLEARSRAKSQMGARGTMFERDGNNPLKFARSAEQALIQLLNPAERGFMGPDRAVEDAFKDLQAHQMATLMAMQGALRVTLERFSPHAIRARAEKKGLLAKILPGARDAALWKAYERDFGQVAVGSDEAFMDVFAKEFRRAYDEISAKG